MEGNEIRRMKPAESKVSATPVSEMPIPLDANGPTLSIAADYFAVGRSESQWSSRPWSGSTGSIIGGCWIRSETFLRPSMKMYITALRKHRSSWPDSAKTVSGISGAIHSRKSIRRKEQAIIDSSHFSIYSTSPGHNELKIRIAYY